MNPERIKAALFDFDGVICQTETYRMDYCEAQLARCGVRVEDRRALYGLVGAPPKVPHQDRGRYMDGLFGGQAAYRLYREELTVFPRLEYRYGELLTPGLCQTVARLRQAGLLTGVASNSSSGVLRRGLEECGLAGSFDAVVSGWDLDRRKPDPYIYGLLMDRLRVGPEECVIVEDSQNGIQAGRASGAAAVFALRDRDGLLDQHGCDRVLAHITQLLTELKL